MGIRVPGLLLILLPVVIAGAILFFAGNRGVSVFKKQGVAWGLTALMIVAAIGIGLAKAPGGNPIPDIRHNSAASYIQDDANVLSTATENVLAERNDRLLNRYHVAIGVVTCNYGRDDLDRYAIQRAGDLGLSGYDLIVVLDIRGDNYWLAVGDSLVRDCSDYAWRYMEDDFAVGDYNSAVLNLTEMLEAWYGTYFG